jgi:flagellar hook protein FlgE
VQFDQMAAPQDGKVSWKVTVKEGTTEIGTGPLDFNASTGDVDPATPKIPISFTAVGMADPFSFDLDFSNGVHCYSGGNGQDTLHVAAFDGYVAGNLTQATFDADGVLNLKYSNGQTTKGVALALARFNSPDNIRAVGDNLFDPVDMSTWETGTAQKGAFGSLRSGVVEISNVDLSSEFSDLVIMQRGYQASSQVVSTANEMIQELFSLKGR